MPANAGALAAAEDEATAQPAISVALSHGVPGWGRSLQWQPKREAMAYTKSGFSRGEVDRAGRLLALGSSGDRVRPEERAKAREVVGNWRSSHSRPLLGMRILLEKRARRVDPHAEVAQRLKRLWSIEAKLRRFPKMALSRMQDLGGCRVVVSSVEGVEELHRAFLRGRDGHKLATESDYIQKPKANGYRSLHLVYRFHSRAPRLSPWNGHRVEVQIRSRIQHIWATAVETIDALKDTTLKVGGRDNGEWDRFFALMGSAMARTEGGSSVPSTPTDSFATRNEVRSTRLDAENLLGGLSAVVNNVQPRPNQKYLLLTLNAHERRVHVAAYPDRQLKAAQDDYLKKEIEFETQPGFQVCLVATDSIKALKRTYPNYFLDASMFRNLLDQFLRFVNMDPSVTYEPFRSIRL